MAILKKKQEEAPATAPAPKKFYHVFVCEFEELEKTLAHKDPDGKGIVCGVWPMGSAVRVVMKIG